MEYIYLILIASYEIILMVRETAMEFVLYNIFILYFGFIWLFRFLKAIRDKLRDCYQT